jgi:hypothetical protein
VPRDCTFRPEAAVASDDEYRQATVQIAAVPSDAPLPIWLLVALAVVRVPTFVVLRVKLSRIERQKRSSDEQTPDDNHPA